MNLSATIDGEQVNIVDIEASGSQVSVSYITSSGKLVIRNGYYYLEPGENAYNVAVSAGMVV
jgi:bacillopeptidase F (M6 metalloprotease family)